jgi:putative membrane protein
LSGGFHPAFNAALNLLSASCLVAGYIFIKRREIEKHKRAMIAAFAISVLFLVSYLTRYALTGTHRFSGPQPWKTVYLAVLFSHMILAAAVPFMAIRSIFLGLKDRRPQHRKIARITLPAWLYVSVTGVVVYLMLYVIFP